MELIQYINDRYSKEYSECTHLSLIGGKYKIEYKDLESFYKVYFKKYKNNAFLVEKVKYPCRFYIDIDKIEEEKIKEIVGYFSNQNIVICTRESEDTETGIPQTGIHIYTAMEKHSPEECVEYINTFPTWLRDYCDTSVYCTGLRMIGSRKNLTTKRVYYPRYIIQDGSITYIKENEINMKVLWMCSIIHRDGKNIEMKKKVNGSKKESIVNTCNETYNFGYIHEKYENVEITKIVKYDSKYVMYTKMKYCMNVDREHKNAKIYFVIYKNEKNKKMIYQKCSCKCHNTGCSRYKSKEYRIKINQYNKIIC